VATATTTRPRTQKIAPFVDNVEILRAPVFHTPGNPFENPETFVALYDGALAIQAGRIAACGDYITVRAQYPEAAVRDLRDGCILPGLIDLQTHFPLTRVAGALGYSRAEWREAVARPEEARLADLTHARVLARECAHALAAHGTTLALVFSGNSACAAAELCNEISHRGLRAMIGLGLGRDPEAAYRSSKQLMEKFDGHSRLRYAVSAQDEPMLEVCRTLAREHPELTFAASLGECAGEGDRLALFEQYELIGRRSILAHSLHTSDDEIRRLGECGATVAHCPSSNAALGSGIFPARRHLEARVRIALGTDTGAGTGFGILKEALHAYLTQRNAPDAMALTPAQLLWMATSAGAEALGLEEETGDFKPGKAADLVYLRPPAGSALHTILGETENPEHILSAVLTLAGAESVCEVRVEGDVVYEGKP
jgi:guanine deaminase